jgi:2-keto-4-pentenoate hydratase/2-oxohepta-3-ene-1,7-dioic acid hydratase in catechol pathway
MVVVQISDSSYMLWKIDELISYVSQFFTLKIGDIILQEHLQGCCRKTDDILEGF